MEKWKAIKQKQAALIACEIMGRGLSVAAGWDLLRPLEHVVAGLILSLHSLSQTLEEDRKYFWIPSNYNSRRGSFVLLPTEVQPGVRALQHLSVCLNVNHLSTVTFNSTISLLYNENSLLIETIKTANYLERSICLSSTAGVWSLSQLSWVERRVKRWTSVQLIARLTNTHSHRHSQLKSTEESSVCQSHKRVCLPT